MDPSEPTVRQGDELAREIPHLVFAHLGAQTPAGHVELTHVERLGRDARESERSVERVGVVEQSFQTAGKAQMCARGTVSRPHLDDPLEPDVGEKRREVHVPVSHGRPENLAVYLEAALHELSEGQAARGVVGVVADQEEHRHVERPLQVALVSEVRIEDQGIKPQRSGSVSRQITRRLDT